MLHRVLLVSAANMKSSLTLSVVAAVRVTLTSLYATFTFMLVCIFLAVNPADFVYLYRLDHRVVAYSHQCPDETANRQLRLWGFESLPVEMGGSGSQAAGALHALRAIRPAGRKEVLSVRLQAVYSENRICGQSFCP